MRYLLDTHTLLWFLQDDPQLPEEVRNGISDIDNKCYISIASLWEIAIKIGIGKLTINFPFERFASYLSESDIELIPISLEHLLKLINLDMHHRDPFDRLIIAQAITENLTILSRDQHFKSYTENVMWR